MAKRQPVQQDNGITGVQKMITLCMLAFMGYLFFMQDRHIQQNGQTQQPSPSTIEDVTPLQPVVPEPVKVRITDTDSGAISFSDLRKGKVLIGKWEIELDTPEVGSKEDFKNITVPEEVLDNMEVQFEPDSNLSLDELQQKNFDEPTEKKPTKIIEKSVYKAPNKDTKVPASAPKGVLQVPENKAKEPAVPSVMQAPAAKPTVKAIEVIEKK